MKLNLFLFVLFLSFNTFASEEPKKRKSVETIKGIDKKYKNADGSVSDASEIMLKDKLSNLIEETYFEQRTFPTDVSEMIIDYAESSKFFEIVTIENQQNVAWSPDGHKLATVGDFPTESIKIWDAFSGKGINILMMSNWSFSWFKWTTNSKLLSVERSGIMIHWDIDHQSTNVSGPGGLSVNDCSFNPDSNQIASVCGHYYLVLFTGNTYRLINELWHNFRITSISWSNDGTKLAIAFENGIVCLVNPITGERRNILSIPDETEAAGKIFWSNDDSRLILISDHQMLVWDLETKEIRKQFVSEDIIHYAALSPDSNFVAYSPGNNFIGSKFINFWDIENDRLLLNKLSGQAPVKHISWSPNGKQIAAAFADNTIKIWGKTFA